MSAIRVWWRAWRHLQQRGYIYVWANLCFVLTALPVVTAPAAFAGLVKLSHASLRGERADLNTYWQGVRENLGRGALLGTVSLFVIILNGSNLIAYSQLTLLGGAMRTIWLGAILIWVVLMLYFWPLFFEMDQPSVKGALQNALLMILQNPLFAAINFAGMALIAGLSIVIPPFALLLGFSFAAIVSTAAVADRLNAAGYPADRADPGANPLS